MNVALTAGLLTLLWAIVHLFLGGREVARPLREAIDLPELVRATAWMCWHMVTATLFLVAALFLVGGWADRPDLVVAATLLSAGIAVAGILAAPALGVSYRTLPQGWLFVPVSGLGLWAMY
ncbi:hypothetical protein [Jannaschia aquimarina]|uniref:DUF423 domain-containing protein n=1 Tax=Jannaschia aquimarina TaxID=935700 RepID=A0A0D1EHX8_9RHOB|nr:hypothetical protein [Jannaschia aquimarina]KIT16496.1 hypothetical protein jaqu_17240 [Jannaschia aquimarina]SNT07182.1 hypothetical protein SAMN05421775_105122 [Jannaschia aquimarina]